MIFWLLCGLLTVVGILVVLRPLLTSDNQSLDARAADLALYRDQLAEIDRDQDRGLFNTEEAEAAKLEVSRRILATGEKIDAGQAATGARISDQSRVRIWSASAIAVMVLSIGTYAWLGSPGMPGQPHAERLSADPANLPVSELVARVEARLKSNPNDGRGWDVIAPIYLQRGQYQRAAQAYQRSIQLNGESPRRLAQFAESILGATGGGVNDTVKAVYDRLLELKPNYLPAHFWLAIRLDQKGDRAGAIKAYEKLLARTDIPEPMKKVLTERLASARNGKSKTPAATVAQNEAGKGTPLTREAREEMARLTPEKRQARIRQMVDGLAERLYADGGDLNEWQRLIRSYMVLGNRDKAQEAFKKAGQALAKSPQDVAALQKFAKPMGLSGPAQPRGASKSTSVAGKGASPSREAREEIGQLSPEKRQARIRQMVDGLAERLNADGGDLNEWQRLIRAYMVLGDRDKALAALKKATEGLAKKPQEMAALQKFAKSMGLAAADQPRVAQAKPAANPEAGKGASPSRAAREELARLTPEKRQARIRQMVDGLAERLNADGGSLKEW